MIKTVRQPRNKANIEQKFVGMAKLGWLLEETNVLVELEDFKNTTSTPAAKRKVSAKLLMQINTNKEVDVLHGNFETLMNQLKTNTSLTEPEMILILSELQS